jgi:uncharacterized membrane protein YkgB
MPVSLWAVLGVVLVLLGLALLVEFWEAAYAIGAGVAFLLVAFVEWGLARIRVTDDPDLSPDGN